jgi:hypothetical protein
MNAPSVGASPGQAASKRCGFCPEFVKRALRDRPQIKTSQISVGMLPRQLNVEENSESPENSGMYACKPELKALIESGRSPASFLFLS